MAATDTSIRLLSCPPCSSGDGTEQGIRLGLGHVEELAARLGSPQLELPIVLVAGTNGKGSTASMLASMLQEAGYTTGLFTSPHLHTIHERIAIDGIHISERSLSSILRRIHIEGRADPPTVFEALTLAAWVFFEQRQVDIAVMEVGLGGRLDATNACQPLLSIITAIGLDHTEYLGHTIRQIADEKLGVARTGKPLVSALTSNQAGDHLRKRATNKNIPLIDADQTNLGELERGLPIPGKHQVTNLALAVTAADELRSLGFPALDRKAIETGMTAWQWPGRCEWRTSDDQRPVLLDVAHNPAAAKCLADYLDQLPDPFILLFGVLDDKDANGMLDILRPRVDRIILTQPSDSRAWNPNDLSSATDHEVVPRPAAALRIALERARDSAAIVVTGSHALVGEVRSLLPPA